jgi:hypothetical protein
VEGVHGAKVVMKIGGKVEPIVAGKVYSGDIAISLVK